MRRSALSVALLSLGLIVLGGLGTAQALEITTFDVVPVNSACLPEAAGHVTVFHKEDQLGVDTLLLRASGLPANTDFAVFLTVGSSIRPRRNAMRLTSSDQPCSSSSAKPSGIIK